MISYSCSKGTSSVSLKKKAKLLRIKKVAKNAKKVIKIPQNYNITQNLRKTKKKKISYTSKTSKINRKLDIFIQKSLNFIESWLKTFVEILKC